MFERGESLQSSLQMSKSEYLSLFDNLYNAKKLFHSNPLIIHQRTPDGRKLLHIAAGAGNNELVRFLLDNGADINVKSQDGMTPLHYATIANKDTTVKLLIERNALLLKNNKGNTALHISISVKRSFNVRNLIGKKYPESVNIQNNDGNTALHLALKNGFDDGVDHLILNMQADDAIPNNEGATPLILNELLDDNYRKEMNRIRYQFGIAARGELSKLKSLIESDKKILQIRYPALGLNLLHAAAFNGQLHIIKYLTIEQGLPISDTCTTNRTALLCALQNGKIASARYLLNERRFPLPDKDTCGITPLLMSVYSGDLDTVKYLVENSQDNLTEKNNFGTDALQYTAIYGHLAIFVYLLQLNKFRLDYVNTGGHTALLLATQFGHFDIVKYLIDGNYVTFTDTRYSGICNILTLAIPHYDIFKCILERVDLANNNSIYAMECAIKEGKVLASIIDNEFERRIESIWQSIQSSGSETQKSELVVMVNDLANLYFKIRPDSAGVFFPEFYTRTGSPEKAFDMYSAMLLKDGIKPEEREKINLSIAELFLTMKLLPVGMISDSDADEKFAAGIGALPYILPYNSDIAQRMKSRAICFVCNNDDVRDHSKPFLILPHIMVALMKHLNPSDYSPEVTNALWKFIQDNLEQYSDVTKTQHLITASTMPKLSIAQMLFSRPAELESQDKNALNSNLIP